MKRSEGYWEKRAEQRMGSYFKDVEKEMATLSSVYLKSSTYLQEEAAKVLKTFALSNKLSEKEAKRLLNELPNKPMRKTLEKLISGITDQEAKKELKVIVESPAYAWRIQRIEALQEDINDKMNVLYNIATTKTTSILQSIANDAYLHTIFDIQQGIGYGFSFSQISISRINEVLKQPWLGEHYSKRLWNNTQKLAKGVQEELLTGFITGRSYQKTAAALKERMASGSMEAKRLIYTEANYVANQAEKDSYEECEIETYRYLATLDKRTSPICRKLDKKKFSIKDAVPGKNYPPMHPWCRSTTTAEINEMETANLKRRAKDPETGKYRLIPYDMSYEEWHKLYM